VSARPHTTSPRRSWVRAVASAMACLQLATACYTYVPAYTAETPVQGDRLSFDISDAGRVQIAEKFGPGVVNIEGRVAEVAGDELAVDVYAVTNLTGGRGRWSGERVRIPRSAVARTHARKFSRARTALAIGGTVVGLGLFIITRTLIGGGSDASDNPGGGNQT
jgi:hypothetical protein